MNEWMNETYRLQTQTGPPFNQSDAMIIVGIARHQEGGDAMFQTDEWSPNGEKFVPGDGTIRVTVQIAPFPDGSVTPASSHVRLGLQLHLHVVFGEFVPFGQIAHHIEEPVAHASRKVLHVFFETLALLMAFAIIVDMQVAIDGSQASGRFGVAQTALLIDGAVRRPSFICIGADTSSHIQLFGTLWNANASSLHTFQLANSASAAVHFLTGID